MPTIKLTRRTIAGLSAVARPTVFYDTELTGFGLSCRPTGARRWVVEYRPGAGGRGTAKRRLVLGDPVSMPPEVARKAAADILARVRLGGDPAGERSAERKAETVAELAETWLDRHVVPKRKPRTTEEYRRILDTHILPALGSRPAAKVTRADAMRLHIAVADKKRTASRPSAKRAPKDRPIGGKIVANRVLAVLGALVRWGAEAGLLPADHSSPTKGIEPFREVGRERYLSPEEMARLGAILAEAETVGLPYDIDESAPGAKHAQKPINRRVKLDPHAAGAIRLLLLTGARLREILNLEWRHVDLDRGVLRLPDSKTGAKVVPLGGAALAVLEAIPRTPGGRYVIASTTAGTKDEQPRRDVNRPWRAVRKAAGLSDVRLHDLRHGFAATGAGVGLSLHQIGGLLGHSHARTTQRYAHLAADPQRRAADMIAGEIAAALGLPSVTTEKLPDQGQK